MYGYSPHYKLTLFNDINSAYKTCKPQIFPHFYLEFGAAEPANGLFRNYRIIFCFLQIFHSNFYYTCAKILKCFYLLVSVRVNIAGSFFWAIKRCDNVIKDLRVLNGRYILDFLYWHIVYVNISMRNNGFLPVKIYTVLIYRKLYWPDILISSACKTWDS